MEHYRCGWIELAELFRKCRERNMLRAWQVALAPFVGIAHVDDLHVIRRGKLVDGRGIELGNFLDVLVAGFPVLKDVAAKNSANACDSNFAEFLEDRLQRVIAVRLGNQIEITVLRNESAHPVQERPAEWNVQRARNVSSGELLGGADVDNGRLALERLLQLLDGEEVGKRSPRQLGAVSIDPLHQREIARRHRLVLEHSTHERLFVLLGECPVEQFFVAER